MYYTLPSQYPTKETVIFTCHHKLFVYGFELQINRNTQYEITLSVSLGLILTREFAYDAELNVVASNTDWIQ